MPPDLGQSPADLVSWAFKNAWAVAYDKSKTSDDQFTLAQTAIGAAPTVQAAPFVFTPVVVEPPVDIPYYAEGAGIAEFYSISNQVINQLVWLFGQYITDYFPNNDDYLTAVGDWLTNAITKGGTGIKPSVEDQIWQRDRARIIAESDRVEQEALAAWSGRGYSIPPGAAIYQTLQVQRDAADRISQASRDVAIKQADMEVENVRFAVAQAKELYLGALNAASDYIKALSVGFNAGMQLIPSVTDSQSRLISAANGYYSSRIQVEELKLKAITQPAEYDQAARMKNGDLVMDEIKSRIAAAIAAAQSTGTQAAAALNGLHASTSTSGSSSNSVGYSYSNDTSGTPAAVALV